MIRRRPPLPPHSEAGTPHGKFFEKALTAAGEWARFADPKLFGVLVFLGLGVSDLVKRAGPLWHAHGDESCWGWVATISFTAACALAAVVVATASFGLFPRTERKAPQRPSLFFFAGIAEHDTPEAYERAVRGLNETEMESHVAHQAWEVSKVAQVKHQWAKVSYKAVLAFLTAWAIARTGLSFVE